MLIGIISFYCLSVGEEPDILTQERQDTNHPACPNTHPHLPPRSCILYDQHTTMYALWFEVGKKWLQIRVSQITCGLLSFSNHQKARAGTRMLAHNSDGAFWFMFSSMHAA